MGFKDILNYPLLRGERAERWAGALVQKPALLLAVAVPAVLSVSAVGPFVATGVAALAFTPVGAAATRFVDGILDRSVAKALKKPDPEGESEARQAAAPVAVEYRHDGARTARLRQFALALLPERFRENFQFMDAPLEEKPHATAVSGIRRGVPIIAINMQKLDEKQRLSERVEQAATFLTAHEAGHFHRHSILPHRINHYSNTVCNLLLLGGYAALAVGVVAVGVLVAAKLGGIGGSFISGVSGAAGSYLPASFAAVLAGGGGRILGAIAQSIHSRQEEYACDRFAIRNTRNMRAAISCLQEAGSLKPQGLPYIAKPDLFYNSIAAHPCAHNRVREMGYYLGQVKPQHRNIPL